MRRAARSAVRLRSDGHSEQQALQRLRSPSGSYRLRQKKSGSAGNSSRQPVQILESDMFAGLNPGERLELDAIGEII
jgi:hypothetical protein